MAEPFTVHITGLRETVRALRRVDRELPKMLRKEANAAAEGIVRDARRRYALRYTSRSGRTVNRIRARSTQTKARVVFGGARYPWAPGQEFGSNRVRQFSPWSGPARSGSGSQGHFLYPAAREGIGEFRDALEAGIAKTARAAALRTRGF